MSHNRRKCGNGGIFILRIFGILLCLPSAALRAGGPRWVTGPPFFTSSGAPVVWYTNQPLYFTDPGDLSTYVNHAAADALVAAAAGVWNVPTSSLVLSQGGSLNEHVSEANAYLGVNGLVLPSDVESSNYLARQIAVIYDTDGSVTDLLLGNGASDPSSCLQNGVTESVDSIVPSGYIQHAILVLNGRCTGSDPEKQLQLQYQLMRAFGRVLGLGWSQTNDNVFTASPLPTASQMLNWPVMHPRDIICGPYTYQCMQQPFTLRPDDLSALGQLYYIAQGTASGGKVDTLLQANTILGLLQFPNGQGMQGVNVLVRRWEQYTDISKADDWFTASSVSGGLFRQSNGNPVTGQDSSFMGTQGTEDQNYEGYFDIARVPMLPGDWQALILETEPINPLYTGQYAVGPYPNGTVAPSGSDLPVAEGIFGSYASGWYIYSTSGPAPACDSSGDGTESSPSAIAPSGWWTGQLCGYGHTAWTSLDVKANRTFTVEVTAEDEQGFASIAKAQPVIGLWNASDTTGSLPDVAAAATPFNGQTTGMTTLTVSNTQPRQLRMVIADQRGDGRPDFNYQARVLYADSVSPASLAAAGGAITVTGMGFRQGDALTINGVAANVTSWTSNTIVAVAPSLHALGATKALAADITVADLTTGGTATMRGALHYSAPSALLSLLTAPSGTVAVGQPVSVPFAVQVVGADGMTPVVGEAVTFSAPSGSVQFGACAAAACTVSTDSHGVASTFVTPASSGTVCLEAAGADGSASVSFQAVVRVQTASPVQSAEYLAPGATVVWSPQLQLSDNLGTTTGLSVNWVQISGPLVIAQASSTTNGEGIASTSVTAGPLAAGASASFTGCAWIGICATFTTWGVDPSDQHLIAVSGQDQIVAAAGSLAPVVLEVTDSASHPVAGATVTVYQTMEGWQAACPDQGRCPIPPTYASSQVSLVSDINGLITIGPQQLSGIAETTNIAASVGTQGFLSFTLQKQP